MLSKSSYKSIGLRPEIYDKLVSITPKNVTYSDKINQLIDNLQNLRSDKPK